MLAVCRAQLEMQRRAVCDWFFFFPLFQWLQREHCRENAHLQASVGASHVVWMLISFIEKEALISVNKLKTNKQTAF